MKLLLTSGGLRNQTLIKTLLELTGKPAEELKVAFIPTAMNTEPGDKGWAIDQLIRIRDMGVKQLDIVDVSAVPKNIWLPRLEEADVVFVNGGNTTHLMTCFNNSGLTPEFPRLLKEKVYVGVSAGSYVATPDLRFNSDNVKEVLDGLKLIDFGLQVHMNSPKFPLAKSEQVVKERVEKMQPPYVVYGLDDQMAVKVDGDKMEIVGEGKYLKFEPEVS
ncbi:MAG TPA: Type 1 glutamine amidotransferase-like domain-containing protein [Candidatus Saccharimonadales bacterium]|nr:Type 1 glutamine amidotransferase-like domain-containing protein [Candidatus Saccharimonadales bacterium]